MFVTEYKNLENYLGKMAASGWMLNELRKGSLIFERIEPKEYTFNVSLFYHTTPFDYPNEEKDRDYRELCEDSGWIFCAHNQLLQVFYKPKDRETLPIHTDPREEYAIIKKIFTKTELIIAPCIILFLLMGIMNIHNFSYENLLSNSSLTSLTYPFLMVIYVSIYITFSLCRIYHEK